MKQLALGLFFLALFASPGFAQITVSGSTGADGTYPSLTNALGAFEAINGAASQSGNNIVVTITGDSTGELGTNSLNAGTWTSLTINPSGARTVSGSLPDGVPLINLNGADNVTIDGLNTGGNALTISNASTGSSNGTSTIRFVNNASNNTITNCTILGSATPVASMSTQAGTILFQGGNSTGNDNNTISNCNIGPAGTNFPSKAISVHGIVVNDNGSITGNNIYDFFSPTTSVTGILIENGNDAWTIANNRFYQTAARTFTSANLRYAAITLNSGTGGHTVSGNTVGFGAANGTGTTTISGSSNAFRGIDIVSVRTTAPATLVENNIISGIHQTTSLPSPTTSPFIGVAMGNSFSGLINATGNTVGSPDGSSTIVIDSSSTSSGAPAVMGILKVGPGGTATISNNNIGSIAIQGPGTRVEFTGIFVDSGSITATVAENTIAGVTNTQTGNYQMHGIRARGATLLASGNTIRNFSAVSEVANTLIGILSTSSTGTNVISRNTVHSFSIAAGSTFASTIRGLDLSLPATANLVERNLIHSLSISSTATGTQIVGISSGTTGSCTYQNNMIRLGLNAAGASITNGNAIIGMRDSAGSTNSYYHNSVYIGGAGVAAGGSNSHAFFSDVVNVTRNFLNNIFWNARGNAVAGGPAHFAIQVAGTGPNPAGLTSDRNVLYFSGTDGATGFFNGAVRSTLAAWRTATGQDGSSFAADPMFIAPNGTAATGDLHIHPTMATVIEGNGVAVGAVTDDFDGQIRSSLTPTDIGADAGNFAGVDMAPPSFSYTPLANTVSTANRTLSVMISDNSGVITGANGPRIYFKKATDASYVSTQCTMTGGTAASGTYDCTIDNSLVGGGSVAVGDSIQYFVVAQDAVGNLGSSPAGATGPDVHTVTFSGTPASYTIQAAITGNKTVGVGGDYANITAAINALNAGIVSGPTTFLLIDSSYTDAPTAPDAFPLTINSNAGSSSTNTVTFKPASGQTVSITGSAASALFTLNAADWIIIDGSSNGTSSRDLTITNSNAGTASAVIWLQSNLSDGATNNTIKNVNLVGTSVTATPGTLIGVGSGSSTIGILSAGTGNHNNTIQNCAISKTQYGIYSGGSNSLKTTGLTISGNSMNAASPNNLTTGAILIRYADGVQITDNQIGNIIKHDGTSGTAGTAFGIALGLVPANQVGTFNGEDVINTSLLRNRIHGIIQLNPTTGDSAFGIVVNSVPSGTTRLINNMVSEVRAASTAFEITVGIAAGGGTGSTTQMYYNSVSMTGTRGAADYPSYAFLFGRSTMDVRNNVFSNTQSSTGTGKIYAIAAEPAAGSNMISNYNDLFVSGPNGFVGQTAAAGGFSGNDHPTLADWQAALLLDANSLSVDPLFLSATDLHISASPVSPMNAAATPIAGITTDLDGQTRNATTPDIGADELLLPGRLKFSQTFNFAGEGDGNMVLTVQRVEGGDGVVGVSYATSDDTAVAPGDYAATSGMLSWADGDTADKTIMVPLVDDSVYETNENFYTTLSNPTGGAVVTTQNVAAGIINENDTAPTLSINDVTVDENAGMATFTVTQSAVTETTTSFQYATADGTAVAPGDYTATSGSTTITAGNTTRTIEVPIANNFVRESTESFTITLSDPNHATIADGSGTGTITDDDAPPTFTIDNVSMNEGNAGTTSFVFTVTKVGATDLASSVNYATSNGTATTGDNDYVATNGTLNFAANETTMTVMVTVNGDAKYENNETFTVDLSDATGGAGEGSVLASGTGTITNDDDEPTIQFSAANYGVNENAGTVTITVTKMGATALPASVSYSTSDGTATQPADYASASGTLNFSANETSKTFQVTINDDATFEGNEEFNLSLSSPSGATLGTPAMATVTINEDDASPLVQFSAANFDVNEGVGTVTVTVTKIGNTALPATVNYATSDGSATAGSDYTATSGMLTFAPNDTSETFTVPISQDAIYEGNEMFTVTLSMPIGASLGSPNPATVTILEDDAAPTFTIDDVSMNEGDSGTTNFVFTVTKNGMTAGNSSVDFATMDGTATTANNDYVAASGTLNFTPSQTTQTMTVQVNGDTNVEPEERFTVVLSNIMNDRGERVGGVNPAGTGTILNDDPANVTVNPGAGSYITLKNAFDAINAGTHTGAITVSIDGDTTETAPAVLNASGIGSASYNSVMITPNGARTVSGAIAAGSPLIDLNGADDVTIDGLNTGGNSLTLSNTNVSGTLGTSTIRFVEGAADNVVRNATILGSSTGGTAVVTGTVLFSTSTVAGGNSGNTIANNQIGPAGANLPSKGLMSFGSASPNANTGNVVDDNNIFDFFNATNSVTGINLQANSDNWTLSDNRIYQTAARIFTSTVLRYSGITLNSAGGAHTVSGNRIGFGAADGTGTTTISGSTNTFRGIDAQTASTAIATSIQGNTISGINQTTASTGTGTSTGFIGLMLGTFAGRFDVGTVTGNNIGSLDGSSTIVVNSSAGTGTVTGIHDFSLSANSFANNNIGSITVQGSGTTNGFRGVLINTSSSQLTTITNNTIANVTDSLVGNYAMYGIQVSLPPASISGNTVRNLNGNSNGNAVVMSGIVMSSNTATAASTISQNTVHSLNNTVTGGAAGALYAIDLTLASQANVIERNFIHSVNVNSTFTTYQLWGLVMRGAGSATFQNNMIRLGLDAVGNSITTGFSIIGIREIAGSTCNFYNNTVYIGGTGVASASNTFAFNSSVVNNTRNYLDNIFWNARSNGTGMIANVALAVGGTAPNPPGLMSDYNVLFANGNGGAVGVFNSILQPTLADWQAATGQEANSVSADPALVNPAGTAATLDLHLACGSAAQNAGVPIGSVTNDFDGDPRSATTPDIGADEVEFVGPTPVSAVSRKVHGPAGTFDISLPGVENRSGGGVGNHQIVVTFAAPVTVASAAVTEGTGMVAMASGNGTNTITIDLTGVSNAQYLTVTLGCTDDGLNLGDVNITMGVLVGDANGNRVVNGTDVAIVKFSTSSAVSIANFRSDVTANGTINASDVGQAKAASGSGLPLASPPH